MFILFLLGWAVCGVLAFGLTFAYFQRQYPTSANENRKVDVVFSSLHLVLGYLGLLASLFFLFTSLGGYKGFKFKFWD